MQRHSQQKDNCDNCNFLTGLQFFLTLLFHRFKKARKLSKYSLVPSTPGWVKHSFVVLLHMETIVRE